MRGERSDHTFRPTELVHEAFVRMIEQEGLAWENRAHFFGIAARAMRRVLVDHAREKRSAKRGGRQTRITMADDLAAASDGSLDLLLLHDALERLEALDARAASVAEMRVFAGLTSNEIAHVLGVSRRTADGDWLTARAWLSRELAGGPV
jgi:RNA polymerase sigma factor (TIGR02999 family)